MKAKLLILLISTLLLSSCYTQYRHVYRDTDVDDVYIYDINYVYNWHNYDPFWRYDVRFAGYYNNYYYGFYNYYGLYYYTPRYYSYPYYYNYKPYRHHTKWRKNRPIKRHRNVVNNQHYRPKNHLMTPKTNIKSRHKSRQPVMVQNRFGQKNKSDYINVVKKRSKRHIYINKKPSRYNKIKQRPLISGSKKRSTNWNKRSTARTKTRSKKSIKTRR